MPKMSDLNPGELAEYIQSYERKVKREPGNMEYQRKLEKLRELQNNSEASLPELENFPSDEHSLTNPSFNSPSGKVEKFHDDEEDHSFAPPATFGSRAVALFIDGIILGIAGNILSSGLETVIKSNQGDAKVIFAGIGISMILSMILNAGYYIYFLGKDGQTIGKKVMKIKVVYYEMPGEKLSVGTIIMREILGKWLSAVILMIGYITFLLGNRTWHDRIAKTNVIRVN